MICSACGHENPGDAGFCGECGASLARELQCSSCGRENPGGQKFCHGCGQQLGRPARDTPTREPASYTPKHLADKILQSKSALEGERKQVTILFADVKGSTELAEQVDPEEWHTILDRFFQILADGVHRFEGTVNQYTGDGIMALFGAPIAHENHARRACYAVLHLRGELRAYAEELKRRKGVNFSVRMGLNSGEVIVGKIGDDLRMDYTAQGQVVNLAERVEQLATPESAYVTEHTARLVEGFFQLRDLGEFELKGLSEPIRVHELEAAGPARTRLDAARLRGFTRFVGRQDEMTILEVALEHAVEGHGQVVGVVGEAGVGKSRLCAEFVERCRAQGTRVLEAHCPAYGKAIPLVPILELLRASFSITEQDGDQLAREKVAGRLLLLDEAFHEALPLVFDFLGVPDPARPGPQIDPEARQQQLFAFFRRLVHARSEREAAILFFDDLHWIDGASDEFLAQLVEATGSTRTLLLVNFRPEYSATWSAKSYYQQLPLNPLGAEEVAEMIADLLGSDDSVGALPALIQEKTGGNPFFTEEVVRSLVECGALQGERGAYRLVRSVQELDVPATVQALLGARIDRLSEQEKQVLHTAAVIGREFSEPLLSAVVDLPSEDLLASLNRLKSGEFILEQAIYPVAEYAFKHPLTEQVARESQLQGRRRRTHAAVARAIEAQTPERLDENAALLAHHFEEAGEAADAVRWHRRAAQWASRSDPLEGLRHWRRVAELGREAPASPELDEMRLEGCRAFVMGGAWRLGLAAEEVEALVAEGEEIAQRLGDSAAHAALLAADAMRLFGLLGRTEEAFEAQSRALALAARSGDREIHAATRAGVTHILGMSGRLEESLQSAREQYELGGDDPNVGIRGIGYSVPLHGLLFQAWMSAWLGRIGEARALSERALVMARELGQLELLGFMTGISVHIAFLAGDREGAKGRDVERTALEHVEIAEKLGSPYQFHTAYRDLGLAHLLLDRPEEAVSCLERSLGDEYHMALDLEGWPLAWLAVARLAVGDVSEARRIADRAVVVTEKRHLRAQECLARVTLARVLMAGAGAAEAAHIQATLDAAETLVAEINARALSPQITELRGGLARLLGDGATCERDLREAHRLYTEIGATGHAERLARELEL